MSTVQTMRSPGPHSRRQILTSSSINKRNNDRNNNNGGIVNGSKPSAITTKNLARPSMHRAPPPTAAPSPAKFTQPVSNNHLLAGYLAQEFLSKGTLFGEPWDPDRTEDSSRGEKRKASAAAEAEAEASERRGDYIEIQKQQRYIEVADILKGEATHLPGIFNPSQLARFLQMG